MSTMEIIKKLRIQTGAGVMDVKEALDEAGGDEAKALELLRKKGLKVAAKKQDRSAEEGRIDVYIKSNGKIGAMVALACETDFVARNEEFQDLAKSIAMHIAATDPSFLSPEDIPEEVKNKEKEIYAEQMKGENKPPEVLEKIIKEKIKKFYEQVCLLNQKFIKDDDKTIQDLITEATAKLGEKIEVKRFVRFQL